MEDQIVRTEQEIEEILECALAQTQYNTTSYPDLSYEQGLLNMFAWLTGDDPKPPIKRQPS